MKYINSKTKNIEYKKRKGAYAIIKRKVDNKIAIATNGVDFFYFGGGIEKKETKLEALKREMLEETGYTIKNVEIFDEIGSFFYSKTHGYIEAISSVYIAEFDKKCMERVEKDHSILWVKPEEYIEKMYTQWQNFILKEYIDKQYK